MENINLVPLVVAVLGAGGAGAFIRDGIDALLKLRGGMSARESQRKVDIVQQREEAIARSEAERERADHERTVRLAWTEYAFVLRRQLIDAGISRNDIEQEPEIEQTIPRAPNALNQNPGANS